MDYQETLRIIRTKIDLDYTSTLIRAKYVCSISALRIPFSLTFLLIYETFKKLFTKCFYACQADCPIDCRTERTKIPFSGAFLWLCIWCIRKVKPSFMIDGLFPGVFGLHIFCPDTSFPLRLGSYL